MRGGGLRRKGRLWLAGLVIAVLCFAGDAGALPQTCAITGNLSLIFGQAAVGARVKFQLTKVRNANLSIIVPSYQSVKTDSNGNLPTGSCLPAPGTQACLPYGATVQVTILPPPPYTSVNAGPFTVTIPMQATVDLNQLILQDPPPPSIVTGIVCPSCSAVVNPAAGTVGTASITVAGAGSGFPLVSNVSANNFEITTLAPNVNPGDALSQGFSHLNDLASATGNYSMAGNRLLSVGCPTTGLQAIPTNCNYGTPANNDLAAGLTALGVLTSGTNDTAIGNAALAAVTTGGGNTAVGSSAGAGITTGGTNIVIGYQGGGGTSPTTGSGNVMVGNNLTGITATSSKQLDIGDTIEGVLVGGASPAISILTPLTLGVAGTTTGTLTLTNATGAGTFALQAAATTTTYTLTMPATAPAVSGQVLAATTAGAGSWATMESAFGTSGALGGLTSTAGATLLQTCIVATRAGHFVDMDCTTDLNGATCTTAPTFNVRDNTAATTGTAAACGTSAGLVTTAENLAFSAGDTICLVRTVNGATCSTPVQSIEAHISFP